MTLEEAVKTIIEYAQKFDKTAPNANWYAGITKRDPNIRKAEHESEKGIKCAHFEPWSCGSEDAARKLEQLLEKAGFAIEEEDLEVVKEATKAAVDKNVAPRKVQYSIYVYKAVKA